MAVELCRICHRQPATIVGGYCESCDHVAAEVAFDRSESEGFDYEGEDGA